MAATQSLSSTTRKFLLAWLGICLLLVACMVVVGGLTRLTDSGLSMTEWRPVTGWLPPLSHEGWMESFEDYRQSPQYRLVNRGMSLAEYQGIFWLEYLHRLLGRIVGLVFALPFLWLLVKRALPRNDALKLGGIFLLGGLQGVIGWVMVASGLKDVPWVSPVKLTLHLLVAFLIFCLLLKFWLRVKDAAMAALPHVRPAACLLAGLIALTVLQTALGGLVAGLDAGLLYNSFPDMDGYFLPPDATAMQPFWHNLLENPSLVQFNHRMGAYLLLAAGLLAVLAIRPATRLARLGRNVFAVALLAQMLLGIVTLLHGVPIIPAVLHQLNALILLAAAVTWHHAMREAQKPHATGPVSGDSAATPLL